MLLHKLVFMAFCTSLLYHLPFLTTNNHSITVHVLPVTSRPVDARKRSKRLTLLPKQSEGWENSKRVLYGGQTKLFKVNCEIKVTSGLLKSSLVSMPRSTKANVKKNFGHGQRMMS